MKAIIRKLRSKELQRDLKEATEYRLLRGLNGQWQPPPVGKAKADDLLPHDPLAIKRVTHFLEALKAAFEPDDALGLSSAALSVPTALDRANRYLKGYTSIVVSSETGRPTMETVFCAADPWENEAMKSILWMLTQEELFRLRRCPSCESRKWFYALRDDQRFCSANCRQKAISQSPEYKEKRARYMREVFRPGEKDGKPEKPKKAGKLKKKSKAR